MLLFQERRNSCGRCGKAPEAANPKGCRLHHPWLPFLVRRREEWVGGLRLRSALPRTYVLARKTVVFLIVIRCEAECRNRIAEHGAERDVNHVVRKAAAAELAAGSAAGFNAEI